MQISSLLSLSEAGPDTIKFLIDKGAEISVENKMCWNPAQLVSFRATEHVELFDTEEYRSLFSKRDALGRTALHYAVVSGRLDIVRRIYELYGKEVDQKDNDGWTPLIWAVRVCGNWSTSTYQQVDIIQFLKDQGADLCAREEGLLGRGWSPLKVARYYGAL
jgi:ankyrin repeat protein